MDSVKSQIETLMKAGYRSPFFSPLFMSPVQTASEIQKKVDELVQPIPSETNDAAG